MQIDLQQSYTLSPNSKKALKRLINEDFLQLAFGRLSYYHTKESRNRLLGYDGLTIIANQVDQGNRLSSVELVQLFYPSFAYIGQHYIESVQETIPSDIWKQRSTIGGLIHFERSKLVEIIEVIDQQTWREFNIPSPDEAKRALGGISIENTAFPEGKFDLCIKQSLHSYLAFRFADQTIVIEKLDIPEAFEVHFDAGALLAKIQNEHDEDTGLKRFQLNVL